MSAQAPRWLVWVALAVALVAAFSAGRFTAPERVEERVEYRTEYRTKTVTVRGKSRVVYVEVEKKPDGTVLERRSERETTKEEEKRAEARLDTGDVQRRVELRPDWRVGVQAGAALGREPAVVLTGPLVLGVSVERRIVGGVSAGVWANTVGAGGASVSVEF